MKTYNVLHARGQTNYVSATYCLYVRNNKKGNLTTAGLGKSYFSSDYYWLANHAYTDSIDYMPKRYNAATKNATVNMLKCYSDNIPFTFYTFCPLNWDSGYKYRTKYLTKYLTQTVDGFYNKYNKFTKAQWEALSHN